VCTYDDYGEESYAGLSEFEPPRPLSAGSVGGAGSVHRIESGNGAVNAPHLNSIPDAREIQRVVAGHGGPGDADEGFGAGIE
jgi:hypothetical protein